MLCHDARQFKVIFVVLSRSYFRRAHPLNVSFFFPGNQARRNKTRDAVLKYSPSSLYCLILICYLLLITVLGIVLFYPSHSICVLFLFSNLYAVWFISENCKVRESLLGADKYSWYLLLFTGECLHSWQILINIATIPRVSAYMAI